MTTDLFRAKAALAAAALALLVAWWPQPARPEALIGELRRHRIAGEETLVGIAREARIGFVQMLAANPGVDPWLPEPGRSILLPVAHLLPHADRRGIVINLAELRLYFHPAHGGAVRSYAIAVGAEDSETPTGRTEVVRKQTDPTWFPPDSIRTRRPELPLAVPPGPANPLGRHALYLGWKNYVIHATNRPLSIGRRVSGGCIRLYPKDMAELYEAVPPGTPVQVVDQPMKTAWSGGELYLEVHPDRVQQQMLEKTGRFERDLPDGVVPRVLDAAGGQAARIDWAAVCRVAAARRGVPQRITVATPGEAGEAVPARCP